MKRFILSILAYFSIVAAVDLSFGKAMDYMYFNARGGDIKEKNDICLNQEYDVIVMGSSRARHHYVPQIINDSLGMSCFNAGRDGNGIILMYGIYQMIAKRYYPSLIIYEVTKEFDIYENPEDSKDTRYIHYLRPYYKKAHVDEIIKAFGWLEWMKTYSALYRYNSILFSTAKCFLQASSSNNDGYLPISKVMDYEPIISDSSETKTIDSLKLYYFERFIRATQEDGVPVVFVLSPSYKVTSSSLYEPIKHLCEQSNVPFLDFYSEPSIAQNRELFKDPTHLNHEGAERYMLGLVPELKKLLSN